MAADLLLRLQPYTRMAPNQEDIIRKQYYTIGEVARELDLTTSLIRFWETEFKEISPKKNRKGNRVYTPRDISVLKKIRYLLKDRKFTIKGAKERMRMESNEVERELMLRETLINLRSLLSEIKESL
jgi:DNA-binding transcriptional MerR regulator